MSEDREDRVAAFAHAAGKMVGQTAKALGGKLSNASPEVKSATAGGVALGGAGLATGAHVGIAALGTAVSGAVILPVAGAVVGALAGYTAFKMAKDRKTKKPADQGD